MGITKVARWSSAPTNGLDLINENILRNHNGQFQGKWQLSVRTYRSTLTAGPGAHSPSERTMCALTMSDHVFVLVDDPFAPTRADLASLQPPGAANDPSYKAPEVPHYRNTFLTLSPPGALEQLLTLLRARWISTRQSAPGASQSRQVSAQQVVIDGNIFAIGSDWIVRAGNVILAGGTVKGILLEAEYLPVSTMIHQPEPTEEAGKESSEARHIPELLSELLLSILPNDRKEKISAVTISDAQWEDVLWDREAEENQTREVEKEPTDDIYAVGEEDLSTRSKSDWEGVGRDRRSAYFIMGALKSERLV